MERIPKPPTMIGPDDWFVGNVSVDTIAQGHESNDFSVATVHFSPCAHTAWHRHGIGQTLICTEGIGYVQARDGELIELHPGDVVFTPAGQWHWHGAAPDHFMVHIAVSEGDVEWGEHLTDAEYDVTRSNS